MVKRTSQNWILQRPKADHAYQQALRLYWQGETESAISSIVDQISEGQSEAPETLYRLWIEILAHKSDEGGLEALLNHLQNAPVVNGINLSTAHALMALVHYELGQREAALLFWSPLRKLGNLSYQRELGLLLEEDEEIRNQAAQTLVRISGDFFHLRRASLYFHERNESKAFQKCIEAVDELFENNPLRAEIGFHQAFGSKDYDRALGWAKELRNSYPVNTEYQFHFAYCSYLMQKNDQALKEFLSLNRRFEGRDPDVLTLIGATLLKDKKTSERQVELGRNYLIRARDRLHALGLPTRYTEDLLMRLDPDSIPASGRFWIVKLTARQAWELNQRGDDGARRLHKAMGEYVGKGDLCFFITESRVADNKRPGLWRLHALYQAASEPEWHPVHRWQTSLDLVTRLEVAVPIEIEGNQNESNHPAARYGLMEIEPNALAHFEDCISEFTLDDSRFDNIMEHLKTARAG